MNAEIEEVSSSSKSGSDHTQQESPDYKDLDLRNKQDAVAPKPNIAQAQSMSSESANLIELYNKYEINQIKNKNLNDDRDTQSVVNKSTQKIHNPVKRLNTMSLIDIAEDEENQELGIEKKNSCHLGSVSNYISVQEDPLEDHHTIKSQQNFEEI